MKYDVMIEVKEEILEIVQYKNTFFKPASKWNIININELTPTQYFIQTIKDYQKYIKSYKEHEEKTSDCPIQIFTNKKIYHKEWVYFKTINIDGGELRKNDYYEIDGQKNRFEIVYNNKTDTVELRVDYTKEIVKHPSYEKVEQWHDEFKKLFDDYMEQWFNELKKIFDDFEKEKFLKDKIKKEIQEEMGKAEGEKLMNEAKKFVKRQKENAGFFKKLFRR